MKVLFIIFIFSPCLLLLWFAYYSIKETLIAKRETKKELDFINKWKQENKSINEIKSSFDWDWKYSYKQNYLNTHWCSNCKYWVEIKDDSLYEYRRGICKIQYKQSYNTNLSTTTNDWNCKYYKNVF